MTTSAIAHINTIIKVHEEGNAFCEKAYRESLTTECAEKVQISSTGENVLVQQCINEKESHCEDLDSTLPLPAELLNVTDAELTDLGMLLEAQQNRTDLRTEEVETRENLPVEERNEGSLTMTNREHVAVYPPESLLEQNLKNKVLTTIEDEDTTSESNTEKVIQPLNKDLDESVYSDASEILSISDKGENHKTDNSRIPHDDLNVSKEQITNIKAQLEAGPNENDYKKLESLIKQRSQKTGISQKEGTEPHRQTIQLLQSAKKKLHSPLIGKRSVAKNGGQENSIAEEIGEHEWREHFIKTMEGNTMKRITTGNRLKASQESSPSLGRGELKDLGARTKTTTSAYGLRTEKTPCRALRTQQFLNFEDADLSTYSPTDKRCLHSTFEKRRRFLDAQIQQGEKSCENIMTRCTATQTDECSPHRKTQYIIHSQSTKKKPTGNTKESININEEVVVGPTSFPQLGTQLQNNVMAALTISLALYMKLYESISENVKDNNALVALMLTKLTAQELTALKLEARLNQEAETSAAWQRRLFDLASGDRQEKDILTNALLDSLKWMRKSIESAERNQNLQRQVATTKQMVTMENRSDTKSLEDYDKENQEDCPVLTHSEKLNKVTLAKIRVQDPDDAGIRPSSTSENMNCKEKTSEGLVEDPRKNNKTKRADDLLAETRDNEFTKKILNKEEHYPVFGRKQRQETQNKNTVEATKSSKKILKITKTVETKEKSFSKTSKKGEGSTKSIRPIFSNVKQTRENEDVTLSKELERTTRPPSKQSERHVVLITEDEESVLESQDNSRDLIEDASFYIEEVEANYRQNVMEVAESPCQVQNEVSPPQGEEKTKDDESAYWESEEDDYHERSGFLTLDEKRNRINREKLPTEKAKIKSKLLGETYNPWNPKHPRKKQSNMQNHNHMKKLQNERGQSPKKVLVENLLEENEGKNLNRKNVIALLHCVDKLRKIRNEDIAVVEYIDEERVDKVVLHLKSTTLKELILKDGKELLKRGYEIVTITPWVNRLLTTIQIRKVNGCEPP
ncbi:restin homolog [Ambystoma mexicanum]|uniref:restin homolog n=1 Tax=Ambystoma mexicanum TaxID=8296 RepID=UPI0037E709B2